MILYPTLYADPTLTINNLCHVTSSIEDWRWWGLGGLGEYNHGLGVPDDVMREIRYDAANPTEEDKKTGVLLYFLHNIPSASWERVAGVLYYMEEEKALQAVKEFMTVSPGGSSNISFESLVAIWLMLHH